MYGYDSIIYSRTPFSNVVRRRTRSLVPKPTTTVIGPGGEFLSDAPFFVASFPGLLSPNAVEGLVKLVRRMTSGGRLEAWLTRRACQFTGSATPPDVHLTSFYVRVLPGRPSTALGDRRPGNEATFFGLSLWTEFKLANCACASGWSCLINLDLHSKFLPLAFLTAICRCIRVAGLV